MRINPVCDLEQIHQASLDLLENPGIRIEHEEICKKLMAYGAMPGHSGDVVRLPRKMVMELIELAPGEVSLDGRGEVAGRKISSQSESIVWSVPGMNYYRHGQFRPFTSIDMAEMAQLVDALPQIDGVFGMSMNDVEPNVCDVAGLKIMAENTEKHIRVLCFTSKGGEFLRSVRDLFKGNWLSIGFTAHGPLRWTNLALKMFEATAGCRMPVTINGEPMAGASGPVTLAGAAAVGNAEILAGIIVNQILEPGRPCIYNLGLAHVLDMRTATAVTGGPENHLLAGVSAGMGRFYNLPSCSWVSSESMLPDAQAGLEKALGFQSHFDAGVSLVWSAGQLESELTISAAQAVIDNEIIGSVRRMRRGIEVNQDTLAVAVTREVGISGSYLETEHTFNNFRQELWEPPLLLRSKRDAWAVAGSMTLEQAAEKRADELIARQREKSLQYAHNCGELRKLADQFIKSW